MLDGNGRLLETGDRVYAFDWDTPCWGQTPRELIFEGTINGHPHDGHGWFCPAVGDGMGAVYSNGMVWKTPHQAVQAAIARCHHQLSFLNGLAAKLEIDNSPKPYISKPEIVPCRT